jgi:dolichol-phosphate mannosyltransferase
VLSEFERCLEGVRVIFRSPPNSLSRSWYEGFSQATKTIIVCMDADLCHDPCYLPPMLELMATHDMVIGSRYVDQGRHAMEGKSLLAVWVSIIGQHLTRWATGITARDSSHSFRMFQQSVFRSIRRHLNCKGNAFMVEFSFYAYRAGFRIVEMPIIYGKRIHGETKLKVSKEGLRFLRLLAILFVNRRRKI